MTVYINGVADIGDMKKSVYDSDEDGRVEKDALEITLNKLLKGAGSGADPTEIDVPALTSKLLSHTRDMSAASGDVSYTGYGFQPKALIIFGGGDWIGNSWGLGDENLSEMCIDIGAYQSSVVSVVSTDKIIRLNQNTGGSFDGVQTAVLKTLDSDGFTLTWTKTGTSTYGTGTLIVLAIK